MANRNIRQQAGGNRRMDFGRVDRKGYGRPMPVSPWQQGGPSAPMGNLLPLASSSEATLALANNLISNLLQARQTTVPSLLDMPIRRDFGGDPNRGFDRGFNRMGNQPNFRRGPGNYVRPSDRPNFNRKPFKANDGQKKQFNKKDAGDSKPKQAKPAESAVAKESETKESEVEDPKDANAQDGATDESTAADGDSAAPDAENAEGEKEGDKKGGPKTAYDGIKSALLHCHICNKVMWDGRSFENHINGRAHHIMMQKTAESYALTADTMRQELKIREMKHYRKQGLNVPRNFFCTMCDMYAADGAAHRTTIGHRKLKKYLHPACTSCHKEMPTRIELDEHRLTPEHLLSVQGRRKDFTTKPKTEAMVISTLAMEESYIRFDRKDNKRSAGDNKDKEDKDKEDKDKEDKGNEEAKEEQEGGEGTEETPADENLVLDWKEGDDVSDITNDMIPKYVAERGVGRSFLTEFTCMQCTLCRKLLDSAETAEVHLRTWRHHLLFVKHLQRKSKPEEVQNELKRTSADEDEDDSSSSSKRRKIATDGDGATNGDHQDEEGGDGGTEEGDAEGDGEDVEMAEDMQEQQQLWEKDLQLILDDADEGEKEKQVKEPEPAVEEEAPVEPEPVATPSKAKTPRGRGRGRGRGVRGART